MPSRILHLICRHCSTPVLDYKKSGSGRLVRLYVDCITGPGEWARLKNPGQISEESHTLRVDVERITGPAEWDDWKTAHHKPDLPRLVCPACGRLLGLPVQYGRRKAYQLVPGALGKQRD